MRVPHLVRVLPCLLGLLAVSAAQAEARLVRQVATVDIAGASFDEAASRFDQQRATTFGRVDARFDARYTLRYFPGWCQVTGAVVEATVTGAVPQWAGAAADATARQRWEALTADIRSRVAGMERDALAAAQEMDRQIEALPSQANCDEVKVRAGQVVESVKTRHLGGR